MATVCGICLKRGRPFKIIGIFTLLILSLLTTLQPNWRISAEIGSRAAAQHVEMKSMPPVLASLKLSQGGSAETDSGGGEQRVQRKSPSSKIGGTVNRANASCDEQHYWIGEYKPACNKHYFSFVLCVRNDNYGGSFQQRVRAMLQATLTMLDAHAGKPLPSGKRFSAEIVLVEYRPSREQPLMKDIIASYLSPYLKNKYLSVRVITVPSVVIETWPDPKGLIVAEYVGKNIGIRRARGEFVLAANADDVLSEALIRFISKGLLDDGAYYRAPLLDPFFPPEGSEGWGNLPADVFIAGLKDIVGGDVCKWKRRACSYMEKGASQCKESPSCRAYSEEAEYNGDICNAGGLRSAGKVKNHPSLKIFGLPNLGAPGDFVLMSRKSWFGIGAHAEVLAHRHHFDGWMECRALFVFKIAQVNLNPPCVVLHQDHGGKKFRSMIVSRKETEVVNTAASGKTETAQGPFGMRLNGVPKAQYRTVYSAAKRLENTDVERSRRLTSQWIESYRQRNIKGRVLDAWDWNEQLHHLYGSRKPLAKDIINICNQNARGGPGERLFDGREYHPEHFGWPEWVYPEIVFET